MKFTLKIFVLALVVFSHFAYAMGESERLGVSQEKIKGYSLVARQSNTCSPGYKECPNGVECCPTDHFCASDQCCPNGSYQCSDSAKGCCPIGSTCLPGYKCSKSPGPTQKASGAKRKLELTSTFSQVISIVLVYLLNLI